MSEQATRALAAASSRLVVPHDVSGALAALLVGIQDAIEVDTCGMIVANRTGEFEVLSVSTHDTEDLTLFESQTTRGPVIEAFTRNAPFAVNGVEEVREQWRGLAAAMEDSGYTAVLACPLRWDGRTLGAVAAFRRDPTDFSTTTRLTLQAFADLSMVVVMHAGVHSVRSASARIDQALDSRIMIEQAKGVLAHQQGVDMAAAYVLLKAIAAEGDRTMTDVAERIVANAGTGDRGSDRA